MDVTAEDRDFFYKNGVLPQYEHLRGMPENMPVIRKLLGLSEYGRLPDTGIGRALQKFVDNDKQNVVRQGVTYQHPPIE